MTQIDKRVDETDVQSVLLQRVETYERPMGVWELVNDLTSGGFRREAIVSTVQREIASGALRLTGNFMVINGRK